MYRLLKLRKLLQLLSVTKPSKWMQPNCIQDWAVPTSNRRGSAGNEALLLKDLKVHAMREKMVQVTPPRHAHDLPMTAWRVCLTWHWEVQTFTQCTKRGRRGKKRKKKETGREESCGPQFNKRHASKALQTWASSLESAKFTVAFLAGYCDGAISSQCQPWWRGGG